LTEDYWATFDEMKGVEFEKVMAMIEKNEFKTDLPSTSNLDSEGRLAFEESNVLECLKYSRRVV